MSRTEPLLNHPRYRKIKYLNKGAFGTVQLALDLQSNELVAIKFLPRGKGVNKNVERELMSHRILWHDHIVKFQEVFLTRYHLGIVLEYAEGGDLLTLVQARRRLEEDHARWIFQQVIVVVDYLHKMGVANRDIKLENTLYVGRPDMPVVKLCDLGYAKHNEMHSQPDSHVGTPAYLAPEIITCEKYNGMISDIWSCGVMLYVMLVGRYPFERPEDRQRGPSVRQHALMQRILTVDYEIPHHLGLSTECVDLISRILVYEPQHRITISQIQQHPWFLKDLPEGAWDLNKDLTPHQSIQSVGEIKALLKEAEVV